MLTYPKRKLIAALLLERFVSWIAPLLLLKRVRRPVDAADSAIVLVEPFQLGDVLSLAVMLDPLRTRFPEGRIVVWCHTRNAHVYRDDPRVARVIHAPFPWSNRGSKRGRIADWIQVFLSCREMRSEHIDIAIDPRGDVRSQTLMLLGGCRRRIGYMTYVGSNLKLRGLLLSQPLSDPAESHRYLTNLATLAPLLGYVPTLRLPAVRRAPDSVAGARTVLIHPGAGWLFKQWQPVRWARLIDRLRAQFGDSIQIELIAGPGEASLCDTIASATHAPIGIVSTGFAGLMSAISRAAMFICLDSGPMNAAVLINVPTLALFGPGVSTVWRPLSRPSMCIHRIDNYPCHPCNQTACVRPNDPCMNAIEVDEVFNAAKEVLASR